ncbi:hypothetical protein [Vibrio ezurae]|uniref:hypothetical protein n=1 Tax=Vibrio ezurae TaxID=252583 RepID=UPI0003F61E93|nr:hypothetical protein [Vibrio ezurae]
MKKLLIIVMSATAFSAASFVTPAFAGICQQIGDQTICTDDNGNTTTCTRIGDIITCN